MKNSKTLFQELTSKILPQQSREESAAMAYIILEELFNLSRTDILSEHPIPLTSGSGQKISDIIQRLNAHEPLQYILGKAHFFGRTFKVNRSVLIPRPETELLVHVVQHFAGKREPLKTIILDIGTGSGCIAVTLSRELPHAGVYASDISTEALETARENALTHHASVHFMHHDILKQQLPFQMFDVVVSNPPYVTEKEQKNMERNVLDHEPHLALFVPDNDPLIFYNAILTKAAQALVRHGLLAVEINENFGNEVRALFEAHGFADVGIIKDVSSKDRVVKGRKTD
jgi:release factor glutamine methyltransferase